MAGSSASTKSYGRMSPENDTTLNDLTYQAQSENYNYHCNENKICGPKTENFTGAGVANNAGDAKGLYTTTVMSRLGNTDPDCGPIRSTTYNPLEISPSAKEQSQKALQYSLSQNNPHMIPQPMQWRTVNMNNVEGYGVDDY